jgi:hypothetical protein
MKKLYKLLGIIAIGAVIVVSTLALAGCDNGTNGGGGCPNRNCFYNSDSNWSFCNQESCALAYDYEAKCNCN